MHRFFQAEEFGKTNANFSNATPGTNGSPYDSERLLLRQALAGKVKQSEIVFDDAVSGTRFDQALHLRKEPLALCRLHQSMVRSGTHQGNMLVCGEVLCPKPATHAYVVKETGWFDLCPVVGNRFR
jgi:hypothetical protein